MAGVVTPAFLKIVFQQICLLIKGHTGRSISTLFNGAPLNGGPAPATPSHLTAG